MKLITTNFASEAVTNITASSSNPNFPVSNLKHEFRSKVWRSTGTFVVDATNNKINFKESSMGSELTATIASGIYTVATLKTEIKTKMEAVSIDSFTVGFSEITGKWSITSSGSYFTIYNDTGADASASLLKNSLGFPNSDISGSLTYTGSSIAIHTKERLIFDLGSTEDITSVVLLWPKMDGIKLSNTAVLKIEANATNSWTSPAVSQTLTIDNDYVIASHYFGTNQSYRYWSVTIVDPANPYLYVELGVVILGKEDMVQDPEIGFNFVVQDNSREQATQYGHRYVDEYPTLTALEFEYKYMDYDDVRLIENAYRINGVRKPVFVTLDANEAVFDKDHFAIYGKFSNKFSLDHIRYDLFETSLSIEEIS